jgi:hypothetical protein
LQYRYAIWKDGIAGANPMYDRELQRQRCEKFTMQQSVF